MILPETITKGDKLTWWILVDEWMTWKKLVIFWWINEEIWWFSWISVDQWRNLVHNLPTTTEVWHRTWKNGPKKKADRLYRAIMTFRGKLSQPVLTTAGGFRSRDSCLTRNLVSHYGSMGLVQLYLHLTETYNHPRRYVYRSSHGSVMGYYSKLRM